MSIHLGNTEIGQIYLGNTEISEAYLGSDLVFTNSGGGGSLPSGYTELEYLDKPSGNAYINTGVLTSSTLLVHCKMMSYDNISAQAGQYGCLWGGRYASGNSDIQLTTYSNSSAAGGIRLGTAAAYDAHITKNALYELELGIDHYIVNGTTYSCTRSTIAAQREIYIFALNNNNTPLQHGHGRLYSFKMWDGGTLLRDFVPCTDPNNVAGVYDLVNNQFYSLT